MKRGYCIFVLTVLGLVRFLASVSQLLRWLYVLLLHDINKGDRGYYDNRQRRLNDATPEEGSGSAAATQSGWGESNSDTTSFQIGNMLGIVHSRNPCHWFQPNLTFPVFFKRTISSYSLIVVTIIMQGIWFQSTDESGVFQQDVVALKWGLTTIQIFRIKMLSDCQWISAFPYLKLTALTDTLYPLPCDQTC